MLGAFVQANCPCLRPSCDYNKTMQGTAAQTAANKKPVRQGLTQVGCRMSDGIN